MVLLFALSAYTALDPAISRGRLALHLVFMAFSAGALAWYFYARSRRP